MWKNGNFTICILNINILERDLLGMFFFHESYNLPDL